MEYKPIPGNKTIQFQLLIGEPAYDMLYPAQIKINYPPFTAIYEVLLAKKNDQQLGIGRDKYPIQEEPFGLGAWKLYLNGTFNYEQKAIPELTLQRMWIRSFNLFMSDLDKDDEIYESMKVLLRDFLYRKDIVLKKQNNTPWKHKNTQRILHPEGDSVYYSIYNKIDVYDSIVPLTIRDKDLIDKDTISLLHNGKLLLDRAFISEKEIMLQLPLDTGMNIITLFADNYGKLPPNTGAFKVKTSTGEYSFDFSHRTNGYATFLVAQLNRIPRKTMKDSVGIPVLSRKEEDIRIVQRKTSLLDNITVHQAEIKLELWDDAAEDGDSISLRLNGKEVVSGFPVRKERQQLTVTLVPGENRLVMVADNLGSIPPNTAVLRVVAGALRKYVRIKTDLKQNNLLLINYEPATTSSGK
jgi:hypothetical protein